MRMTVRSVCLYALTFIWRCTSTLDRELVKSYSHTLPTQDTFTMKSNHKCFSKTLPFAGVTRTLTARLRAEYQRQRVNLVFQLCAERVHLRKETPLPSEMLVVLGQHSPCTEQLQVCEKMNMPRMWRRCT